MICIRVIEQVNDATLKVIWLFAVLLVLFAVWI